jgi:hypothetical protein
MDLENIVPGKTGRAQTGKSTNVTCGSEDVDLKEVKSRTVVTRAQEACGEGRTEGGWLMGSAGVTCNVLQHSRITVIETRTEYREDFECSQHKEQVTGVPVTLF